MRACHSNRCPNPATANGYCEAHQYLKKIRVDTRLSSTHRGYDVKWAALSRRYKADNPYCERCLSLQITTPGAIAHHIIEVGVAPELRYDYNNLANLCRSCHGHVHNSLQHRKLQAEYMIKK